MPRTIIKLSEGDQDWYIDWSSVVDAPLTYGMSLEEFKEYYLEEYGKIGLRELDSRLERVEVCGTSSCSFEQVDAFIEWNRAGKNQTRLSKQQLIDFYCKSHDDTLVPEGETWPDDESATP